MNAPIRPFRWDIRRREQLGSLADTELPSTPPRFEDDVTEACARVLALAGDSDLVFVGRSPDALFHILSGALLRTTFSERLRLLNLALRREWVSAEAALRSREALAGLALAVHLFDLGCSKEGRLRLARELAGRPAMREPWFRSLVLQLKR